MELPQYSEIWEKTRKQQARKNQYHNPNSAKAYDTSSRIWADGFARAAQLPFEEGDTVLDIGSGPGILAIPLAQKVKTVTVVEPSAAMLDLLQAHCREFGIHNITVNHCDWEAIDADTFPKHDYVIASYSLMMENLKDALAKMDALAKKQVYLYWFSGMTTWEKITSDLMPRIHGRAAVLHPKADVIYGILCQLGISANVIHLEGTSFDREFADKEGAMQDLRKRLNVGPGEQDALLEAYLQESGVYQQLENKWVYRDQTNYVCICWKPKQGNEG